MAVSLVTGAAGFIGSHVVDHCLRLGQRVVAVDDLSGGFVDNVPRGATFVKGSILDHELINTLFAEHGFDYVYHLAAYAAEGLSHFIRRFNYNNNLIGSMNLIDAAVNNNVKRFVFTSSIAVYGAGQTPLTEDMAPIPEDPYGVAKLAVVIAKGMGLPCNVKHLDPRNEVKVAFSDHSKCDTTFGNRRKTTLEEGITAMAEWVKQHGARESSIFKDIEIMRNLPRSWAEAAQRANASTVAVAK